MSVVNVLFAVFAMSTANATVYATLGPFGRSGGLSEIDVGMVFATSGLLFLITSSAWGRFADRRGRRGVIVIGLLGTAGSLLLFAALFAVLPSGVAPAFLFGAALVARILYGLLAGGTQPAATACAVEAMAPAGRSTGAAWIGAAVGLGSIAGPVVAAGLVDRGASLPLLVAAALALLAVILVRAGVVDLPTERRPVAKAARSGGPVWSCVLAFLFYVGFAALQPTTAFFIQDFLRIGAAGAVERAGVVSATFAGSAFSVQALVVHRLPLSPRQLLATGMTVSLLGIVACVAVPDFPWLVTAFAVTGIGYGLAQPGLTTWIMLAADADRQAEAAGQMQAAASAAWITGPIVGTVIYTVDPEGVFILAAGALSLALSVLLGTILRSAPSRP